jgi:hypothetical protein
LHKVILSVGRREKVRSCFALLDAPLRLGERLRQHALKNLHLPFE